MQELIKDKIIKHYADNYQITVKETNEDTFNSYITSEISKILLNADSFDLSIEKPKSNTPSYDINSLSFNNNSYLYKGQWNINCEKHGIGIFVYENGTIYYGNFINDIKKGRGILIQPNGDFYQGYFDNDHINGNGSLTINNDYTYTGTWVNGVKHGSGLEIYNKTLAKYEGGFENNLKHGKGKYYFSDGSMYKGSFVKDLFEGKGVMKWIDGCKYEGEFKKGKMDGEGKFTWKDGVEYIGMYSKGKKNGLGVIKFKNGKSVKGKWINNILQGKGEVFGNKMELLYEITSRYGKIIKVEQMGNEQRERGIEEKKEDGNETKDEMKNS